mmetsp:Transcript_12074/g.36503  ORF Transcript_12074/g.36503 Transcript_12074/m.36503 type:complete len:424 (+) Transcript_12074:156-1427(+)
MARPVESARVRLVLPRRHLPAAQGRRPAQARRDAAPPPGRGAGADRGRPRRLLPPPDRRKRAPRRGRRGGRAVRVVPPELHALHPATAARGARRGDARGGGRQPRLSRRRPVPLLRVARGGPLLAAAASRLPRPPLAQVDRLRGGGGGGRGCLGPLLCPRDARRCARPSLLAPRPRPGGGGEAGRETARAAAVAHVALLGRRRRVAAAAAAAAGGPKRGRRRDAAAWLVVLFPRARPARLAAEPRFAQRGGGWRRVACPLVRPARERRLLDGAHGVGVPGRRFRRRRAAAAVPQGDGRDQRGRRGAAGGGGAGQRNQGAAVDDCAAAGAAGEEAVARHAHHHRHRDARPDQGAIARLVLRARGDVARRARALCGRPADALPATRPDWWRRGGAGRHCRGPDETAAARRSSPLLAARHLPARRG